MRTLLVILVVLFATSAYAQSSGPGTSFWGPNAPGGYFANRSGWAPGSACPINLRCRPAVVVSPRKKGNVPQSRTGRSVKS
jgi:hypothetical protein